MSNVCTAPKADGTSCGQPALYACDAGHILCGNHGKRLGGATHRRKTDRRCSVCRSVKILCLVEEPVVVERRAQGGFVHAAD